MRRTGIKPARGREAIFLSASAVVLSVLFFSLFLLPRNGTSGNACSSALSPTELIRISSFLVLFEKGGEGERLSRDRRIDPGIRQCSRVISVLVMFMIINVMTPLLCS